MEENTERDEVYEQFMQDMQAKKKRQVKRTIREVIMVVVILGVIGLVVWFLTDPEVSEKLSFRKEKEPVAYADIPFTTKDVSSMEFAIAGKVMTFPCTMTDLYDAGYSMNDSDAKIMLGQPASLMIDGYKSYETAICKMEARDFKGEFDVSVINTSTKETAAVDCPIYTVWFDEQFMLCNGISQASTYEEILAAMGKPDEEKEISSMKDLYYEYKTNIGTCSIIFSFCVTYTGMEGKTCDRIRMTRD